MAKAALKTSATTVSVDDFIATISNEQQQQDSKRLIEIMRSLSGAEPVMWGKAIVGFGSYSYQYESGRSGNWFPLGFSPRKSALTIYLIGGFERYASLLESLGKHECGKGCLYIKRLADIDEQLLTKILQQGLQNKAPSK